MKITATIQARMGSTRLPGKVLKAVAGKALLAHQIERLGHSSLIDEIILATTTNDQDNCLEALAKDMNIVCFRGDEHRVLNRIVDALKVSEAELHVEFCGDSPLADWNVIDSVIGFYLKHQDKFDCVSTGLKTTYPPGLEVTVYPADVLYKAESLVADDKLREHVSFNIVSQKNRFRIKSLEAPKHFLRPDLYLEVDTEEDFEVVRGIFEALYVSNPLFALREILAWADQNPKWVSKNRHVHRRWKSFREESQHVSTHT